MNIQSKLDQIKSVRLAMENGEYTEEDLMGFLESFRPTFTAFGATSQSSTIREHLEDLIAYAGKCGVLSDYRVTRMTHTLDSIYASALEVTSLDDKALGVFRQFLTAHVDGTESSFDPISTCGIATVRRSVQILFDYFAFLNSEAFLERILRKVSLYGLTYCEMGDNSAYVKADELLQLLVFTGRLKETERHEVMMALASRANDFNQRLSRALAVDSGISNDGEPEKTAETERTGNFE